MAELSAYMHQRCPACGRHMSAQKPDGWWGCPGDDCGLWWVWDCTTGTFARLVATKVGAPVKSVHPHMELTSFRGEVYVMCGADLPSSPGRTGYIRAFMPIDGAPEERLYPSVFGLAWSTGNLFTAKQQPDSHTYRAPGIIGAHAGGGAKVYEFEYRFENGEGAEFTVVGDDYQDAHKALALWAHGNPDACPKLLATRNDDEAQHGFADIMCFTLGEGDEVCIRRCIRVTERDEPWTERERAHACISGFMRPQVVGRVDAYTVQHDNGDEFIIMAADLDASAVLPTEAGTSVNITLHKDVYLARLSAPGYMDCTEWGLLDGEEENEDSAFGWLYVTYADEYDPAEPRDIV